MAVNEALRVKASTVEFLSSVNREVKDPLLRQMIDNHARIVLEHYNAGVSLLKVQNVRIVVWMNNPSANREPQIGLRPQSYPVPNLGVQSMSKQVISTTVLQIYKHHAIAWLQHTLECAHAELRSWLVQGALLADRMAYEMFMYMNQKGYYQVVQFAENTPQNIINSYQNPYELATLPRQ